MTALVQLVEGEEVSFGASFMGFLDGRGATGQRLAIR